MLTKNEIEEDEYLANKNGYKIKNTEIKNIPLTEHEIRNIITSTPVLEYVTATDARVSAFNIDTSGITLSGTIDEIIGNIPF